MSNKGVHWSVSDEKIAVDMLAESKSFLQVAEKLGRSISSVTAHFDKFFFETYHLKKALKLWKRFNNKYANHNSDEIDISNLKKKDEVYFYNCTGVSDTLLHRRLRNVVCIGWMKCKIRNIDISGKRIQIKHSVYKTDEWIYLNEGKIRLNGNGLYCYDCPSAFKMQQIVNCSCNKLMKKTTIKSNSFLSNKKQNGEIIECISCKKNVEQAHYSLYFSDEKNDIHSTVCVICWVCADKQQYAKVCKKIKIPFYEFETKEKSAKIISNLITINNKLTKELLINKLKTNRSYIW
eukprot:444195_1